MKFDTNKTNLRVLDTMVPVREPQTVVELANFLQSGLNMTPTRARGRRVPVTLRDVATTPGALQEVSSVLEDDIQLGLYVN